MAGKEASMLWIGVCSFVVGLVVGYLGATEILSALRSICSAVREVAKRATPW